MYINVKTYDESGFAGIGEALEDWFDVRGGRFRKQVVVMVRVERIMNWFFSTITLFKVFVMYTNVIKFEVISE